MDVVYLLLTIIGIIIAIIFGYLEVIVPFIKREVRLSKRFPFVESTETAPVVKPRRRRRRKKRKRSLIPILAIGILIVLFVLMRFLVFQAKARERVPIAVIHFTNRTGDEQFNYLCEAIPNLLITDLEQSRYLSVLTWERMRDLLKILGKEEIIVVDVDVGFKICEMDDIQAVVVGSVTKAGNMFVTEVKVLDVTTKKILKTSSSQGEGVASILKIQIDELSEDIAKSVSLYERVAAPTDMQIMEVTTSSMEAYSYFLRGRADLEKYYFDDARKFLEMAIELDSTFAMAYGYLGWTYQQLGNLIARNESYEKAKILAQKATNKERLYIEAGYSWIVEGNLEEAFRVLKEMARRYPKEKRVHDYLGAYYSLTGFPNKAIEEYKKALELDPNNGFAINELAFLYAGVGNYEQAIEYFMMYVRISPGDANPFDSMAEMYLKMGRLDQAIAKYKEALEVKADFGSELQIAYVYALKEDYSETMKWINQFISRAPSPGKTALGYLWRGFYHYWLGSPNQALDDLHRAEETAEVVGNERRKAYAGWIKGRIYFDRRKYEISRRYFTNWFDLIMKCPPPQLGVSRATLLYSAENCYYLAFVDLKEGRTDSAKCRLAKMESLLSEMGQSHENRIRYFYDLLYAEVLLTQDSVEKAIAAREKLSPLEVPALPSDDVLIYNVPLARDVLARAYYKKGNLDKAIAEYVQLITFNPKSQERRLIPPTYHYKLATLYEEKGLKPRAIAEYEKFLDIWKNADADQPELIDAKKRLAKLKTTN